MKPNPAPLERDPRRAPSIPPNPMPLAVAASVGVGLLVWFVWFVVAALRAALAPTTPLLEGGLLVLAFSPAVLFVVAARGVMQALEARLKLVADNLIAARVATAQSNTFAWSALGYALAVFIVFALVWFVVANESAVGKTFLRPDIVNPFGESVPLIAQAFLENVKIFLIAEVFILIWGLVVAVARMIPGEAGKPIRFLATAYTDAFRGLPSIITMYLVAFGLPLSGMPILKDLTPFWASIIALTLTYGAYVAEVYRAGIDSIHPSQFAAARSLGLSFGQTMRFVIVPQAVRRIIPPLLNDFIGLQKDTALVSVIGTLDAFNQAKIIASNKFSLSAVSIVAVLFVLITIPQARWVDHLLAGESRKLRGGK